MSKLSLTLSSTFVRAFLAATGTEASEQPQLLKQAGIAFDPVAEPGARVTEEQFSELYRLLARRLDDEMPGMLSVPLPGGTMKFAGFSLISAPTLGVAIYRYARFLRMVLRDFEVVLSRGPELSSLTLHEPAAGRKCQTMAIELVMKALHGVSSWLTGRELPLMRVDFAFPAPAYLEDLRKLFPGPLFFDRPANALIFESALLELQVQRKDRDLRVFLARQPRDWICVPFTDQPATHQVRECLLARGPGALKVEDVAQALKLSVRTLCRRLEEEHTTFKQVKDDLRRDLAIYRLTQTHDSVAEIADDLGFGDTSTFHRAFRAWTGMTPGAYRRDLDAPLGGLARPSR